MHADRARGFTLLETLIGLVVLALALVALSRTAASQVNAFSELRERTMAGWLAQDVLAQTRLTSQFPAVGKSDGRRHYANRDWRYEVEVQGTDVADIRRIDVRVFDGADNVPMASFTGFASDEVGHEPRAWIHAGRNSRRARRVRDAWPRSPTADCVRWRARAANSRKRRRVSRSGAHRRSAQPRSRRNRGASRARHSGQPLAAFIGAPDHIEFTRLGFANPQAEQRSNLERVLYEFDAQCSSAGVSPCSIAPTIRSRKSSIRMSPSTALRFRFLSPAGQWLEVWPPPAQKDDPAFQLPRAVQWNLQTKNYGELENVVELVSPWPASIGTAGERDAMKHQRGVALLIALLVVALATILIAGLLDRGGLTAARTRNALREAQARNYAKGLEDYAARVLTQDSHNDDSKDTSADIWAVPLPPTPVPGGDITATMTDLDGRFNLNNLADIERALGKRNSNCCCRRCNSTPTFRKRDRVDGQWFGQRERGVVSRPDRSISSRAAPVRARVGTAPRAGIRQCDLCAHPSARLRIARRHDDQRQHRDRTCLMTLNQR